MSTSPKVPSRRRRRQLIDVCIERAGVQRGSVIAFHIVQWSIVTESLGHFPSGREYAEWSLVDERTAFRQKQRIREYFSEDEFESLIEQLVGENLPSKSRAQALRSAVLVA
jgi:hypothetical protein